MKQIRRFLKTGDFYELHVVLSAECVSFLPSASARSLAGQGHDVFIKKSDHLSPENGPRFTEKKNVFLSAKLRNHPKLGGNAQIAPELIQPPKKKMRQLFAALLNALSLCQILQRACLNHACPR